jgi:hypothetical protein
MNSIASHVSVLSSLVVLFLGSPAVAQCELQVLAPSSSGSPDRFGHDVALSGRTLLVGAPGDGRAAAEGGAVFVYVHTDTGVPGLPIDDTWTLTQVLTASSPAAGDHFGYAVAVSGGLAVVSSVDDKGGTVTVFVCDDGCTPLDPFDDHWVAVDEIEPSMATVGFGRTVDVEGGTVAVGTLEGETTLVFECDDRGTPWDRFDDSWVETALIAPQYAPLGGGSEAREVGLPGAWSVALIEDMMLVGVGGSRDVRGDIGMVHVYVRDERGTPTDRRDDVWAEAGMIVADPPVIGGQFGRDIAIHGDMAVVGASAAGTKQSGRAYVLRRDRMGTASAFDDVWRQVATLAPSDALPGDEFGQGVALWGDVAVVGAPRHDVQSLTRSGALYVYARQDEGTLDPWDDGWPEVARLVASDAQDLDGLGTRVAIEENVLVGGSPMSDTPSPITGSPWSIVRPGRAVLFALDCESLVLNFETEDDFATVLENGQAIDTEFGHLVKIRGAGYTSGLPPTIFDTAPGGQNDPGQDLDLLVDSGNALILQERPGQTVPGFFDWPNDDARGGWLTVTFRSPVRPTSMRLCDIDATPRQGVVVTLTDVSGRRRVLAVPSGFTEDLLADGPPGFRTLDLRRSGPQAGFLAVTRVFEAPGFDGDAVRELRLDFRGSGALDDLRFVPMFRCGRAPGGR